MRAKLVSHSLAPCIAAWLMASAASAQPDWFEPAYDYTEVGNFALIHIAAARGDVDVVKRELANGVSVDVRVSGSSRGWPSPMGATPLHFAAQFGRVDVMRVLIEAGADVNAVQPGSGFTALMAAAGSMPTIGGDHSACVRLLLDHGADIHSRSSHKVTALHFAAEGSFDGFVLVPEEVTAPEMRLPRTVVRTRPNVIAVKTAPEREASQSVQMLRAGDATRLKMLIHAGADVNTVNFAGRTPIRYAAQSHDPERVRILLEAGADMRVAAHDGHDALAFSATYRWADVFEAFLDHVDDESLDARHLGRRMPVLLLAAGSWREPGKKVRALLARGLDVDPASEVAQRAALASASHGRDGSAVLPMLEIGVDPFIFDAHSESLLHLAAMHLPAEVLAGLLAYGFDVNMRAGRVEQRKATALILAAGSAIDATEKVRILLEHGADVLLTTTNGISALHVAAREGNMRAVVALVDAGAEVNRPFPVVAQDEREERRGTPPSRWTPLMLVSNGGAHPLTMSDEPPEEAVRALIDVGADVNASVPTGERALSLAIRAQQPEVVRMLLEAGAEVEFTCNLHGDGGGFSVGTPLVVAIHGRGPEIVTMLLDAGADPNRPPDGRKDSPLHAAVTFSDPLSVDILLEAGADVHARGSEGVTPLMVCARMAGNFILGGSIHAAEIAERLLEAGARVGDVDERGMTPLIHLCRGAGILGEDSHQARVYRMLLERGADVRARDNDGLTALHHAAYGESRELIDLLLEAGDDLRALDKRGRNALDHARLLQHRARNWGAGRPLTTVLAYLEDLFAR